jgi:iron complex transport system permease protein
MFFEKRLAFLWVAGLSMSISALCICFGSVSIPFKTIFESLYSGEGVHWTVITQLRFPRIVVAFVSGGLLAMSGCLLQTLLRNPLADPYIFGISSGASLGVLGALIVLGPAFSIIFGFLGAGLVIVSVAYIAHRGADWNPYRLILTGVMVSAGLNALISLILVLSPPTMMKGMIFWMMGDLTYAEPRVWTGFLALSIVMFSIVFGRALDAMSLGSERALAIGVSVRKLEYFIYFLASLAAVAVVVEGGAIGFVGLVVPHMIRMTGTWRHKYLVPMSAFVGGTMVVVADTLARSLWAPIQLPVGVMTAMIGVPILIFLLNQRSYARG